MRIDAGRLRAFLDCMHLEADQRDKHSAQIREIVKAAKDAGYDPKAVRKVFVRERMDDAERAKQDDLLESYEGALGPKGAALRAIEQGATLDEAAAATGLGRATVARARAVSRKVSNDTAEVSREGGNDTPPHDADGIIIESNREAANSSDDAGHRSEPSAPADMGITMSANAGPPLGQSAASLDSQGEQSGTHSGEINEIHRGATQPKGCAKVVRTDASMSESVAASGDAVRDASAMPLDVVAAPHSEGREHAGSAATAPPACVSGTHSGGYAQPVITRDVTTEPGGDAQDETGVGGNVCTDECSGRPTGAPVPESCGEPAAALGAKALARSCGLTTAPLRPHDTPSGGSSTGRTSPFLQRSRQEGRV